MTRGDARAWLDQESALISAGEWTAPSERVVAPRQAEDDQLHVQHIEEPGLSKARGEGV